jgi:gas vesicle protein
LFSGVVAGVAGAVWYSQQTGRDLRAEFQQIRTEIKARDFDALGSHLEDRIKELQTSIDKLGKEASEKSGKAADDASAAAKSAAKEAVGAASS